jgi:dTDP-4-amino-4,6-dideoxygalactose transaminase
MLDRRWLSNNGPYVQELEGRIADYLGVAHCVAVCNATIGLEIAIRALGLVGEVIVPSLTFVATAHALQWQGIRPIFSDVDAETCTLDPEQVETLVGPETTGIIGVHLWGRVCDVDRLQGIADRHNLRLLFDAAHAFACGHNGRLVGSFGDAEVVSFHATKFLNSFEGGAILTNDAALARTMRLMVNFGFAGYDQVVDVGTNGKMTEVAAAMGITSLESIDDVIAVNRRNHEVYARELGEIPGLALLSPAADEPSNYQYIVVRIDSTVTGISRDDILEACWAENVLARRYFYPGCHRMEPYRTLYPDIGDRLLVTEQLLDQVLTLPTGTAITEQDVSRVSTLLRGLVAYAPEVSRRLRERRSRGLPSFYPGSSQPEGHVGDR